MKKFVELTVAVKSFAAMIFSGLIIIYTVFGGFFGLEYLSFSLVWQALFISAIAALLHFWAFSDTFIKKMNYTGRLIVFAAPTLLVMSGFAYSFKWFDSGLLLSWTVFILAYLFFFGIVTLVFSLYSKITGKKYTEQLNAYKSKHQI